MLPFELRLSPRYSRGHNAANNRRVNSFTKEPANLSGEINLGCVAHLLGNFLLTQFRSVTNWSNSEVTIGIAFPQLSPEQGTGFHQLDEDNTVQCHWRLMAWSYDILQLPLSWKTKFYSSCFMVTFTFFSGNFGLAIKYCIALKLNSLYLWMLFLLTIFSILRKLTYKRHRPNCTLASINQSQQQVWLVDSKTQPCLYWRLKVTRMLKIAFRNRK